MNRIGLGSFKRVGDALKLDQILCILALWGLCKILLSVVLIATVVVVNVKREKYLEEELYTAESIVKCQELMEIYNSTNIPSMSVILRANRKANISRCILCSKLLGAHEFSKVKYRVSFPYNYRTIDKYGKLKVSYSVLKSPCLRIFLDNQALLYHAIILGIYQTHRYSQ